MKIQEGDRLEEISLPTIKGTHFSTQELHHKRHLLTFYRFASCPLCNLRIHQFIKRYDELNKDFTMVAIFHSSSENLNRHMTRHQAPFPILADKDLHYFKKYHVQRSFFIFLTSQLTRGLRIWSAMLQGFIPFRIKGSLSILPVDVLVNEKGVVEKVKYGKDIGDHMSFEEIKEFANKPVETP